jgi:hypothetical protein
MAADSIRRAIQSAMGISPLPTAAQRNNEKSGVALDRIAQQQAQGSFQFIDNYYVFLAGMGRRINELITKIYDTKRDVAIRKADDTQAIVRINDPEYAPKEGAEPEHYDTQTGEHEVTVSVGPSSESQREAATDFVNNLISNLASLQLDPGAQGEAAGALHPVEAARPHRRRDGQHPRPAGAAADAAASDAGHPESAAGIAALNETCKVYEQQIQQLKFEKAAKLVESEARASIEKMKAEKDVLVAEITTKAQSMNERIAYFEDLSKKLLDQTHEASLQAAQHAHEKEQADVAAANAAQQQAADHAQRKPKRSRSRPKTLAPQVFPAANPNTTHGVTMPDVNAVAAEPSSAQPEAPSFADFESAANVRDLTGREPEPPTKQDSAPADPSKATTPAPVETSKPQEKATPEPGAGEKPQEHQGKPKLNAEERIGQLTAKLRAAEEALAKVKPADAPKPPAKEAPAPEPLDFDKFQAEWIAKNPDGTWPQLNAAWSEKLADHKLASYKAELAKEAKDNAEKQRVENFQKTWNERSAKAAAKYADFKEVALDPAMPIVPGGIVDAFIGETEVGPELLYHFGKNPAELEKLQGMNPIHAALELAKLVGKFTEPEAKAAPATPAKPTITSAPKPAPKVGGRGTAPEDPVAGRREGRRLRGIRSRRQRTRFGEIARKVFNQWQTPTKTQAWLRWTPSVS